MYTPKTPSDINDYTKNPSYSWGKWVEVGYFATTSLAEKPKIIAKFNHPNDARFFAEYYNKTYSGIMTIIIR